MHDDNGYYMDDNIDPQHAKSQSCSRWNAWQDDVKGRVRNGMQGWLAGGEGWVAD